MNYGAAYNRGNFVAGYPADVRADFIRKVYSLFFLSMLVTVGVGAAAAPHAATILGFWPILAIAGFVCIIALSFARRVPGLNMALLYLYSAIQGAILGPLLAMYELRFPGLAAEAGWVTVAVFGSLTAYVFASKKDFSFLGGMLFMALIALVVAGIVGMFIHAAWLSMAYSVAGVLIFSGFVLYDTSQIMNKLAPEDAVIGAATLYLDFINLFMFILQLLSNRRE
jgi:FtsH-binding integral membrane protein